MCLNTVLTSAVCRSYDNNRFYQYILNITAAVNEETRRKQRGCEKERAWRHSITPYNIYKSPARYWTTIPGPLTSHASTVLCNRHLLYILLPNSKWNANIWYNWSFIGQNTNQEPLDYSSYSVERTLSESMKNSAWSSRRSTNAVFYDAAIQHEYLKPKRKHEVLSRLDSVSENRCLVHFWVH